MTSSPTGTGTADAGDTTAESLRRRMAELRAATPVGELITGEDLRARQQLFISIRRHGISRQSAQQRHVWPVLRSRLADGPEQVRRLVNQKRRVEETLIELRWFGDRDPAVNDVTGRLIDCLGEHLDTERELLARLRTIVGPAVTDQLEARARADARLAPQRPHPNLPATPWIAALLFTPVALLDRLIDAVEFGPSGS